MGQAPHQTDAPEPTFDEDADHQLKWRSKSVKRLLDFRDQKRGLRVNWIGEPSFRAWLILALPAYIAAAFRRLPLWRWLIMIIPHMGLLAAEMHNTALEETIRQDVASRGLLPHEVTPDKHKSHHRNAMDSSSAAVGVAVFMALIGALYAHFGPDPWKPRAVRTRRRREILSRTAVSAGIVAVFGLIYAIFGRLNTTEDAPVAPRPKTSAPRPLADHRYPLATRRGSNLRVAPTTPVGHRP